MATSETAVPAVDHKDHLESEDHAGFLDLLVHQVLLDHHQRSTGTSSINASAINWIQNLPAADYYTKDIVTNWYTELFVTAAKAVELAQLQSAQNAKVNSPPFIGMVTASSVHSAPAPLCRFPVLL